MDASSSSIIPRFTGRTGIIAVSVFFNFAGFTLIIPVLPFSVARYVAARAARDRRPHPAGDRAPRVCVHRRI